LVVELFFAIAGGDWLCQELGGSDCAFQRKGIYALEQMNASICGHVTGKRKRGQADAECVGSSPSAGRVMERGSMLGRWR